MITVPATQQQGHKRFYCKGLLSTEINGQGHWRVLQAAGHLLAQKNENAPGLPSALMACDQKRSVLSMLEGGRSVPQVYSPYGQLTRGGGVPSLLAFNGERPDAITGNYLLGNGYRQFSPVMMRFCSSDSWSPFGDGGVNAYMYCAGDPTNHTDPTGHAGVWGKIIRRLNPREPNTRPSRQVVKPNLPLSKKYINKRDGSGSFISSPSQTVGDAVAFESLFKPHEIAEQRRLLAQFGVSESSISKKVYFQSHNRGPDLEATKRHAQSLHAYKISLQEENKVRDLEHLFRDLDAVNSRLSGAGSSPDLTIQAALQEEIRTRTA
ncbi:MULTISPECIES: RHS repeat-associated core domain-containing protein [unclassified Pseudomonas]|uniref:RHS repeat-associated core domain-containing protein n=1 Tax=unclassified Pseudomonas TaxID=196821 RepID=UPI000CE5D25E|nr:RHS repeat-associated core domain-containing protein [Pseudomonas sp. SWI44]AVD88913.1 hypothetical protein C4Q26_17925 [Pseudomonas sp. SWI44]